MEPIILTCSGCELEYNISDMTEVFINDDHYELCEGCLSTTINNDFENKIKIFVDGELVQEYN